MKSQKLRLFVPMFFLIPYLAAQAQWSSDPALNNPIVRAGNNQTGQRIISDGRGGAIICWHDERMQVTNFDLYAQRIDKDGFVRWTVNGNVVSNMNGSQSKPDIISDGAGGAIIAWIDTRNGDNDIYVQRIDSSGNILWTPDGVAVTADTSNQADPKLATDGKHGAIVVWNGAGSGFPPISRVYAQRIDAGGKTRWGTQVQVSGTLRFVNAPTIASDGRGGAFVSYAYYPRPEYDVYAQRLDSSGVLQWAGNGTGIATGGGTQDSPMLVEDGNGNAFLGYLDWVTSTAPNLNLVVLKRDGTKAASFRATSTNGGQLNHQLTNIGTGLCGVSWDDGRVSAKRRAYAQIIDTTGAKLWDADGVTVSNRAGDQVAPYNVSDGSGGLIVAWEDKTKGATQSDIYAQRISAAGAPQWTAAGVPVGTAANIQQFPRMISDEHNGAIVTWEDYRPSFSNVEIYASRILADGSFPVGPPQLTFSTKTVAFGDVAIGTPSTKSITLSNTGGVAVTLASVTSSDPQFTLTPDNNTIAPSGNVNASVRFQPTSKNTANAYIVIQSNSINGPDTVIVTGKGTGAAAIETDKSSLVFGNVNVGSSKSLAIRITNPGTDTLSISNVASSNTRFVASITSRVVAPGASFDDSIRFTPTGSGPISANLTITSNAATSPTVVSMTGTGTSTSVVSMTMDLTTISFGNVAVGSHRDTTVTVTNTGNDTLRISSFTSGNPRFTVETPLTVIAPADVKTFTLRFAPNAAGPLSSSFTVTSNAVSSPNTISVDGNGVAGPAIAFSSSQLQFGPVEIGKNKDLVLTVNNTGGNTLTVSAITSTNSDFSALVPQFDVPASGSFNGTIRFTPSVLGDRSGMLIIASNASTSPDTVLVQGTGTDPSAVRQLQAFPEAFTLFQNYPNPFNPTTTIRYDLHTVAPVRVTVLNSLGQVAAVLVDEMQHPGMHTLRWTSAGSAPGVYFYVVRVGAYESYGTMVLMR